MQIHPSFASYALHMCSKRALGSVVNRKGTAPLHPPGGKGKGAEISEIPLPTLFDSLADATPDNLPNAAQCAVHLEFLQTVLALEHRVVNSNALDRTLDIRPDPGKKWDSRRWKYEIVRQRKYDPSFQPRRRAKWNFFVSAAVHRFVRWWHSNPVNAGNPIIGDDNLPPIDVLMIWHSFLLNPGMYARYCEKHGNTMLMNVPFPWQSLHKAIDSNDWTFSLSPEAALLYKDATGCEADLLSFLSAEDLAETVDAKSLAMNYSGDNALLKEQLSQLSSSPDTPVFHEELSSAFRRQSVFTGKMGNHLWIRSPACRYTLEQACERYSNFLRLFKLYPKQLFVPTLDIDIAWHTHQLSARGYRDATEKICGRFIDHDDKLGEESLTDGFEATKRLYGMRFGTTYSKCLCWEDQEIEALLSKDEALDPEDAGKQAADNVSYYRAAEIMRRQGKQWY